MEHLQEDREDSNLSEDELAELIETKFVAQKRESENEETDDVEQARPCHSPLVLQLSPNGHVLKTVVLEEHECLLRPMDERVCTDEATLLTSRIQKASEEDLKTFVLWDVFECSKKWKQTSRASELALVESVLCRVDSRPVHLHVFFRRLIEYDVFQYVRKSLFDVPPPSKNRSLLRIVCKMDAGMPLKQLLCHLNDLYISFPDMQITEGMVTAVRVEFGGAKLKLRTPMVYKFSEMEHFLMMGEPAKRIEATVKLGLAMPGRRHVAVRVEYHTELTGSTGRIVKHISIEQSVTPPPETFATKRVSFGTPELTAVHRYELPEYAPFNPLGLSHKFGDLIQYLEGNAPRT